ncbi:MAG: hypothetical protein KJ645_02160 [Planctomycetes bacterium]|nr:hypothetical protein [Planctomycetota bacterium]
MRLICLGLALSFCVLWCGGCGGSQTPKDLLADADKAYRVEKDYEKAMTLCRNLLNWKGEGTPTDIQRFEASLTLIRCQICNKNFDEAVSGAKEMFKIHGSNMTFKNFSTLIQDLVGEKAIPQAIDLLALTGEAYPDQKDMLKERAAQIEKLVESDEDLARLKTLGYL